MKLILLGAPGAGKGTQAENISREYNIPTLSTGAILREAIKNGTELGKSAKSYMDAGQLVPNDVVNGIVRDYLNSDACANGFILDGFPRNIPQAEALDAMGVTIDGVIEIYVPDETIISRMSGRRTCPKCGESYHTESKPSKDGVTCDKCGEKLIIRDDDKPEVVLSRLETYHAQTAPLKDFYSAKGILRTVVGQVEVKDTTALTLKVASEIAASAR